jgi:hypothetical protein
MAAGRTRRIATTNDEEGPCYVCNFRKRIMKRRTTSNPRNLITDSREVTRFFLNSGSS